jgi:hypothetical protein
MSSFKQFFPGDASSIDFVQSDPDAALKRLNFGEVDFLLVRAPCLRARLCRHDTHLNVCLTCAMCVPEQAQTSIMKQHSLSDLDADVFTLPLATLPLVLIHGLRLNASDPDLVLNIPTISQIYTGAILFWDDPQMCFSCVSSLSLSFFLFVLNHFAVLPCPNSTAMNPVLASRGKLYGNITKVVNTAGERPLISKCFIL